MMKYISNRYSADTGGRGDDGKRQKVKNKKGWTDGKDGW
jgi:hypothetical protein